MAAACPGRGTGSDLYSTVIGDVIEDESGFKQLVKLRVVYEAINQKTISRTYSGDIAELSARFIFSGSDLDTGFLFGTELYGSPEHCGFVQII
jgi:hypothetical protein